MKGQAIKRLTKEQVLSIPGLIGEGKTYEEVANILGCKRTTVEKAVYRLRANGIEVITRKGRPIVKLI